MWQKVEYIFPFHIICRTSVRCWKGLLIFREATFKSKASAYEQCYVEICTDFSCCQFVDTASEIFFFSCSTATLPFAIWEIKTFYIDVKLHTISIRCNANRQVRRPIKIEKWKFICCCSQPNYNISVYHSENFLIEMKMAHTIRAANNTVYCL